MKAIRGTGLLAGLAACVLAPAATAGETGLTDRVRIEVPAADLDLRQSADAARLERRVLAAVNRACPVERGWVRVAQACRAQGRSTGLQQAREAIAASRSLDPSLLASR